jgi:TIR domain
MPKILISYRRTDSLAITGRIFDRLAHHYGEDSVFMDVDSIPIGIDFRQHIQETLRQADVLIAVIGANWLGHNTAGATRMHDKTDSVRLEVETALERMIRIIPVLVDGAKMPESSELPPEFGNFVYLNAAEVTTGRDFRSQIDRLIGAIDGGTDGTQATSNRPPSGSAQAAMAGGVETTRKSWASDGLRYFLAPLALLLVAHHVVVNSFDLNTNYLWAACVVLPFVFGFALFWVKRCGEAQAFVFAIALGLVAVSGMTVSQSLNSGDPIMPQTRFEWWDSINFATAIALSYVAGHAVARALRTILRNKTAKS